MGFRDEFFFTNKTYAEWSLERTVAAGFRAERQELTKLRNSQRSAYEAAAANIARSQAELGRELAYQADRIGKEIAEGNAQVVEAVERGAADVVASIQNACDYLGGELIEVRWAIERHTKVSERVLQVLLNSLDNASRQYFEQGVRCYETGESGFAKERFSKALEANRTNYFAYQYLGFIAVGEESAPEAIRNFELAQKFADQAYHRALALSHLARAKRAIGEQGKALVISQEATTISPATPKFWYELANHCVLLGRDEEMVAALRNAIERDWQYFTVVGSDATFDSARPRVNTLLTDLRKREASNARACIEELRKALATAKTVGAENETRDCAVALRELEAEHAQNNVFLHLDTQKNAPPWRTKALQSALKLVEQRIASNRSQALQCQAEKQKRVQELHSAISDLRGKQSQLTYQFKPIEIGCWLYIGLWFLYGMTIYPLSLLSKLAG